MLPLGIHLDVSEDVYHARELGVASKSGLDELSKSPAHYHSWVAGAHGKSGAALRFGQALHCAILTPGLCASRYVAEPDFGDCRKKENKALRDEWLAEHGDKVRISDDDYWTIEGIQKSIQSHPIASKLLRDGSSEVSLSWVDEVTGVRCKARVDYWVPSKHLAIDLKTTSDASPDAFARSIYNYRYHVQEAFYRRGFEACGEQIDAFVFLAVEKVPPFALAVYMLDSNAVNAGLNVAVRDMTTLAKCLSTNTWPGYSDHIVTLELPRWAQ